MALVAARAGVSDSDGDGVPGSSHAIIAASVADRNLPAAHGAGRLAVLEVVADGGNEGGIRVGLPAGADSAILRVDCAKAGETVNWDEAHGLVTMRGSSAGQRTCASQDQLRRAQEPERRLSGLLPERALI